MRRGPSLSSELSPYGNHPTLVSLRDKSAYHPASAFVLIGVNLLGHGGVDSRQVAEPVGVVECSGHVTDMAVSDSHGIVAVRTP
jgi:hypothetical protein